MENLKQQWIDSFSYTLKALESESNVEGEHAWTRFMTKVLGETGKKINCYAQSRFLQERDDAGEFLNIDTMCFGEDEIGDWRNKYAPPALPIIVVEHENMYDIQKIEYCLWKILCLRAPLKILICYQSNSAKVALLKERLEILAQKIGILKEEDLLIVIGDEKRKNAPTWQEYFNCYDWKQNQLQKFEL